MTPFRKKTSKVWFITIADEQGTYHRRSSGTRDYQTALAMQEMVTAMARRGKRWWDIMGAIIGDLPPGGKRRIPRVSVGRVYDHYPERLDVIRREISDVDLAPAIDAWVAHLAARVKAGNLAVATMTHYVRQAGVVFPVGEDEARLPVRRSTITADFFRTALAKLGGSGTNRRRHAAAWSSCLVYLVENGKLERNPLSDVALPKNNKTKAPYIERLEDVLRLVNTMPEGPHRAAAALREGAGVELQAMLATRRRDIVDEKNRVIWAHGGKNDYRDRQVIVDEPFWAILVAYVKANPMHPDAELFPGVSERNHRAICYAVRDALREKGVNIPAKYKPHHARDTFAVRFMKDGRDPVLGANNLGHSDVSTFLRKYAKFRPAVTDLVRADQRGRKEG